jgi:hypothetical protein
MHNLLTILTWIVFLLAQGFVICGIFLSAQGTSETLPDGKQKHSEMILYPLYRYLTRYQIRKIFYKGDELQKLAKKLPDWFPRAHTVSKSRFSYETETMPLVAQAVERLEKFMPDVKAELFETVVCFYKEYKQYRFSKWVRKPLIECVKCMASFWGTLLFWPSSLWAYGFHSWELGVWALNCFSLVFVNAYLHNKLK